MTIEPTRLALLETGTRFKKTNWFRPALPTLVGHGEVEINAVSAATQVSVALLADIAPARQTIDFPFPTAVEAMPRHARILNA